MEQWIPNVNKRDGRLLVNWWNANSKGYFLLRKNPIGYKKAQWSVYRYDIDTKGN